MILLSPVFVLTGLVLTIIELPLIVPPDLVRDEIVRAVTEATGAELEIRALEYDPLSGLRLDGIRLGPPEGFERDTFTAERLEVRYDLSGVLGRKIVVEEVTLESPTFVLETRGGRTNVDAILEAIAKASPPAEDEPPPERAPAGGPLVPVDVVLEGLEIGPLTVELAGEGPTGQVSQAFLLASGRVGRARIDLDARLETRPGPGPGLALRLPASPEQPSARVEGDLALGLDVAIAADSSEGLALEALEGSLALAPRLSLWRDEAPLAPLAAAFALGLALEPPKDSLRITPLTLELGTGPTPKLDLALDAGLEVRGLAPALEGQLGALAAAGIADGIGLPASEGPAALALEVRRLVAPLSVLSPYAELFLPRARMSGEAGVRGLRLEGTPEALTQGRPAVAEGRLFFDEVQVDLPSRGVALSRLDGDLELTRAPEQGRLRLAGGVDLAGVSAPGARVRGGRVELDAEVPRLGYPIVGESAFGLSVSLSGVEAPNARVGQATLAARIRGEDVLGTARDGLAPVEASATFEAFEVVAKTGTAAPYRVEAMQARLQARPQRLLAPNEGRIPVEMSLRIPAASGPGALSVREARLEADVALEDPRLRVPGGTRAKLELSARRLAQGPVVTEGLRVKLDLDASSAQVRGGGPLAGLTVPEQVAARLDASIARLAGRGPWQGLETPAALEISARARPAAGRVRVPKLAARLGDALVVEGQASVRRGLSKSPWAKLALDLERAELSPLVARLPPAWLAGFEDARAEGQVKASLRFEGEPLALTAGVDLRSAPVELDASVDFSQVALTSTVGGLELAGLDGRAGARLGEGGVSVSNDLELARLELGELDARRSVRGVRMSQRAGFRQGEWLAESTITADRVEGAMTGAGEVAGLSSELLARYVPGGAFELPRMSLHASSAGVDVEAQGRLGRGRYGVLVPALEGRAQIDFDRLRALLPALEGLSGRLQAEISLEPEPDDRYALAGGVELLGFGYRDPRTRVEDAYGRVPLEQSLALPPPRFDERVARAKGSLGDDLEARIAEMQGRFLAAKGLFSAQDVLLTPPRHADHDALRPFRRREGADLRAARVVFDRYQLESVVAEARWASGMLRLDHFEAALWDGDVLADMVVQITPDLDLRARARGTVTELNLDIPYVLAAGKPASEATEGDEYTTSAVMDLSFALKTRSLNGRIEITKVSLPLVERLFVGLDLSGGGGALRALSLSERVGVRPVAAKVWIAQNLLNVQFDWQRLWVHAYFPSLWLSPIDFALIFLRPALIPTLGGLYVIPTVNGAIHRLSLSGFLDPILEQQQLEARLQALGPYVAALEAGAAAED